MVECNIKTCSELLETIKQQESMIITQNKIITRLASESFERENMIAELMRK